MNKPVTTAELKPAVTTGALPSSRKIFVTPDEAPDVRVPLREIILSEGAGEPNLSVYDTSGPYTDPAVTIDVNKGLPRNRTAWVLDRGGVAAAKAPKPFSAYHRPLRGIDAAPVPSPLAGHLDTPPPCGEGSGVGVATSAVVSGNPPPQPPRASFARLDPARGEGGERQG